MRKVLSFLGASLALALVVPSQAQNAPDMFKDLDTSHWAYAATESLRSKGIVIGYPDGYFRGKRTLTRYEFAVALDRALKTIKVSDGAKGETGPKGDTGEKGADGAPGPAGMTPEDVAKLRSLADEFRKELAAIGAGQAATNRKIDQLAKDIGDIKTDLANRPKITGGAFIGMRSDNVNGGYVDKDGRVNTLSSNGTASGNAQEVVHTFELGISANVKGGATVKAALDFDNYLNTVGSFGQAMPVTLGAAGDARIRMLEINTPFNGLGRGSGLTIGRFGMHLSHLTWWKPDVDVYMPNPFVDDGMYYGDGAKLSTKLGSLGVSVFGQQLSSNQGTGGVAVNTPLAGTTPALGPAIFAGGKPIAQPGQGQINVDQILGVTAGLNVHVLGGAKVNLTAIETSQNARPTGFGYSGVQVLGADTNVKISDKMTLTTDWAKTNTVNGHFSTVNAHMNNAFNANLGFNVGKINLAAGYKYVDPLFYAPGYWGRIGNWLNPTNIQGPTVRAGYDFASNFGVNVGGDFYKGARNTTGLTTNDQINRILAGVKLGMTKNFTVNLDWEGVYYKLVSVAGRIGNGTTIHPTEQYLTLGTGYHLTDATLLKLAYQVGDFNGHGLTEGGTGTRNTFGAFTTSVAVKF